MTSDNTIRAEHTETSLVENLRLLIVQCNSPTTNASRHDVFPRKVGNGRSTLRSYSRVAGVARHRAAAALRGLALRAAKQPAVAGKAERQRELLREPEQSAGVS